MQINIEVFYKLILSFWVCVARHAQGTQNKKFAYIFAISPETRGDEVHFLPADKYESLLKLDSITLSVGSQATQRTQNKKFALSLQHLKENLKDEVYFLPADKH